VSGVAGARARDLADALDADLDAALRDIADDIAGVWN
jgi:hypothetical protein